MRWASQGEGPEGTKPRHIANMMSDLLLMCRKEGSGLGQEEGAGQAVRACCCLSEEFSLHPRAVEGTRAPAGRGAGTLPAGVSSSAADPEVGGHGDGGD